MAMDGQPGIYTHCSYRTDKSDILPQKEILEMLMEIGSL
jgi:inosine/xanthosine triphosphate pyrophosphatase family protein